MRRADVATDETTNPAEARPAGVWRHARVESHAPHSAVDACNSVAAVAERGECVHKMSRPRILEVFALEELKGSFETQNRLGRGGFGTVFQAQLPGRGSVAVKRLRLGDESHNGQV